MARLEDYVVRRRSHVKAGEWWKEWPREEFENACLTAVRQHLNWGEPLGVGKEQCGSFNACFPVIWRDGRKAIVRFPMLGKQILRREKTDSEIATSECLRGHAGIPIPEVLGTGMTPMGPYVVMPWVDGRPLCRVLFPLRDRTRDPRAHEREVRQAYREMADITLRLSWLRFSGIGSLVRQRGTFAVAGRPLTFTMNELIRNCGLPLQAFPNRTYISSREYFVHLANLHLTQFRVQFNGLIYTERDCRSKLVARFLFLNLVRDRLSYESPQGPFRLYCDDFRPSNVRADRKTGRVTAAIDWEFAYAAPVEFTYAAPWWLIGETPGLWSTNLESVMNVYMPRLAEFLAVMREREDELIRERFMNEEHRLSRRMRASIDNGIFWLCLAARTPSLFDAIYWKYIDQRYYGEFSNLDQRIELLSAGQQAELNTLTQRKVAEYRMSPRPRFPDPLPFNALCDL
ncbi:hypothetical protein ASPCAL09995 [Aspergillus calidoustus]|uniref:Aminoglycoside phosphotransferase domain-containing protein n=1 Tax=Aspergillus calidoustus TaxID=454130 RepID=A0A0U5G6K6_ASPCI|nr:hypothetical protein ASPCAL09995 [Aspergillus calidoustus]